MHIRKIWQFPWRYKQLSASLLAAAIGLALELSGWQVAAHWTLGTVSIILALPLLADMWQDVRTGSYGIDILAITAIVASVLLHQYWTAIVIVIMLTGGETLEAYAARRARSELNDLLMRIPQRATVLRGRKTVSVAAHDVNVGDKIILKPGEVVPVDATILDGSGDFDEAAITGESLPVRKDVGGQVLSGSINNDGAITARCTRDAKHSQYEQIVALVRAASNSQAPFVRLADRYSVPFTIIAYAIAVAVWALTKEPIRFLEVIVVATPCPLLLAAPIAIISGMSRSSKQGIIIKTGGALERLADAQTIAFDKTGTLTLGQLRVASVQAYSQYDESTVLSTAASLEQHSNHVLARAILDAAVERKLKLTKTKQLIEVAGQGVSAGFNGKTVMVGRLSYLEQAGITPTKSLRAAEQTATYVAIDGKLAGCINFEDVIRPESKATLEALRKLRYNKLLLVTGDNIKTAKTIAAAAGIDEASVTAEALPADKLHAIEKLTDRPVVFVGDGVNDAPVLTASDVGIALGARGSTAASESADIVIMHDDIRRVAVAAAIAKRTFRIATQSILIGIAISIGLMVLFATGRFSPLTGAILQEVVDIVVIFNALRAHFAPKAGDL